ncbi:MAG: DNA polymerase III subunit delta' [Proteobacteria bacterium]|nr:DNA polymerase III subunit delta' [Pseudomonadota bacterium]
MTEVPSDLEVPSFYTNKCYYPWQDMIWQKLFTGNIQNDHLPHAILLNGVAGIGKKDFAFYLAKGILCQSPVENPKNQQLEPCHSCRSCQLFSVANHPDAYHLTVPEDKKVIPVDSVRKLIQWSVLNSHLGGKKVIIIEPAEAMNQNAANSLLKTLEEPVADTIIIMLANNKQALLATIRSRCQAIDMVLPDRAMGLNWLEKQASAVSIDKEQVGLMLSLANGAPLSALSFLHNTQLDIRQFIIKQLLSIHSEGIDPVQVADELTKCSKLKSNSKSKILSMTAYDIIYWTDALVIDIVRLSQNQSQNMINNVDYFSILQTLSKDLSLKKLLQLSLLTQKAYYEIQGSININLLFEQLFIDWKNCRI